MPSLPPPPRNVRLTRTSRRNLFMAVSLSFVGIALCVFLGDRAQRYEMQQARLSVNGDFVVGKVSKKSSRRDTNSSAGTITIRTTYHIDYEFNADGQIIRGIGRVPKSLWDRLKEGGEVGVYYVPNNPQIHQLVGPDDQRRQWIAKVSLWTCGGLVMLFLISTISYLNKLRKQQRQLRDWAEAGDDLVNPFRREESVPRASLSLVEVSDSDER